MSLTQNKKKTQVKTLFRDVIIFVIFLASKYGLLFLDIIFYQYWG